MSAPISHGMGALPLIGVVPTYQPDEALLSIPKRYMDAIACAGGVPLALPLEMSIPLQETLLPSFDGFLLSGGQDIDPHRYGEAATSGKLSEFTPAREEAEHLILNYARRYDVPVLGICRGMQAMNVSFGGTLYQDIDDLLAVDRPDSGEGCRSCEHRGACVAFGGDAPTLSSSHCQIDCFNTPIHEVSIVAGTRLAEILGCERALVNSMHHQAIKEVGTGLRAVAHDPNGLIEAIESPDSGFMVGVQWHPEFFAEGTMQPLFASFVDAADAYRGRSGGARPHVRIGREDRGRALPMFFFDEREASFNSACL